MIQKMKKITLLALESHRKEMLDRLSDLGVMHLVIDRKKAGQGNAAQYLQTLESIVRADVILEEYKKKKVPRRDLPAETCLEELKASLSQIENSGKRMEKLQRDMEILEPWGDFDPASVENLSAGGLFVKFWLLPPKAKPVPPDGMLLRIVSGDSRGVRAVTISGRDDVLPDARQVILPGIRYSEILERMESCRNEIASAEEAIASLVCNREKLHAYAESVREKLDFANADLSAAEEGDIVILQGYVPEMKMSDFTAAARKNGWAFLAESPAPDDQDVPTCITKPKWMGIIDPLFDLIGIDPGYRENDVNAFFLIFFPVFFGLIIGDAGYGFVFLLTAILCKKLLKRKKNAQMPLNLFLFLSVFSIAWGWLNGNWFGVPARFLPEFMRGWDFLANPQESPLAHQLVRRTGLLHEGMTESQISSMWNDLSNRIVQWLCFFLAALHLSSARIFKFCTGVRSDWRAWGNLGWTLLLIANFLTAVNLIVFPGTFPKTFGIFAYCAGTLLVAVTTNPRDFLNLPFSLIGSFTDVLSYIRLFAVGLAGTCIAVNFNNMGGMLLDGRTGTGYIFAMIAMILIVLFGHALNIALSFLSVIAHGVRLNTLEFSGHMGIQWTGTRYKPFRKNKSNINNLEK